MTNFAFVPPEWKAVRSDSIRAEAYISSDPRSACFYARRAAEQIVGLIYDVEGFPTPYKDDLAARIGDPAFQQRVPLGIVQKLNLLRKLGNRAVHDTQLIPPPVAVDVLRELHHVVLWTVYHYSRDPSSVPSAAVFDPKLAAHSAPLTRTELVQLAEKFRVQDEEHARALRDRDDLAAEKDAQIAELRKQILAAQEANVPDTRDYSEAQTRDLIIDELLREAGWHLTEEWDREYPVTGMPNGADLGYVDYVQWGEDGLPLAVLEAKRTTREPAAGQQQAKLYADCLNA